MTVWNGSGEAEALSDFLRDFFPYHFFGIKKHWCFRSLYYVVMVFVMVYTTMFYYRS